MKYFITSILCLTLTIFRGSPNIDAFPVSTVSYNYDINEVLILAALINSEAKWEPMLGKIAVGNVVVNRARRRKKSLKYIILEKGQFDGVRTKWFKPEPESIAAAKVALRHQVIPREVEFFHNPRTSTDTKWVRYISKKSYKQIGNHLFCYNPKLC